ncbi:Glucoamylase P [Colletotrichum siamense]|nr:Glucoamylase P [Colletotrichum siamense]KAI8150629.1 Glucoamylase P [Colletotrichum sp. SAR 10_71]KAI8150711.1 Glucoamylase P [Colletotrichum sp. SAR 10_70]KAI8156795.1 Glucoamylase P [Colletotrichum sp. SAR 10_65]KAI8173535.1 Glucoamylase P [Colletotrichum sp. SAR 10_75]KAI8195891.1 Glucoamylase P [Colletotrichum sp. SAR 10_76]KAI8211152.1 Glucoamylase P [Colletotrichum sp. SAR 10_77]KAI8216451.1 Glucoamylase P [Colletotrichum sp. SAR 10_86]KAJ4994688.1 Glucoamylase P [Colletotrichum sp
MSLRSGLLSLFGLVANVLAADLDDFVTRQRDIALISALNNIGPHGSMVQGAGAGIVVASPSKSDPDYFYTWTRDAALTMKMVVDEFIFGNKDLQVYIEDYYHSQAILQTVTNPSGSLLASGRGLGEAKYLVDGSRFNGAWGRPQRDGPALRAITLITYSHWLIQNGQESKVKDVIWPIIANDLSYVGQYWNSTGFDLWEEVSGSSFFTTQSQYRSLVEGNTLAQSLGVKCAGCELAPDVLCFLQTFWNGEYFTANINTQTQRSGKDANVMLGSIAVFDIAASCDDPSIQPCHSKSLANFKVLIDAFRNATLYPINEGIAKNKGVALGRYTEDVYFDGNPWYLITIGAAEFLYDAVAQWKSQGQIKVDSTSRPFFADLYPKVKEGTYQKAANLSDDYSSILSAVTAYADSFVAVAQQYIPKNGSMSEQFNKAPPGNPISAADLTWSYAAFVTMSERRAGSYPPSWTASTELPATCTASSTTGIYAPAIAAGAPNVTGSCPVSVSFLVNATTYYGENVYLVGNVAELGSWNVGNGQQMSASNYSSERPLWTVDVEILGGQNVSYVYARKQNCDQGYIYETTNRTLAVPACGSTKSLAVNDAWEGPTGSSGTC